MVERRTVNPFVPGSSPGRGAILDVMTVKIILVVLIVLAVIADVIYVEAQQGKYSIVFDSHQALYSTQSTLSKLFGKLEKITQGEKLEEVQKSLILDATPSLNTSNSK